jgi:hypothetical protein
MLCRLANYNALCVPITHFYDPRILLLPTPIDFVEQNPFAVIINPVASNLVQLTPVFEQFVKQTPALLAILITTTAVSARGFTFAFATVPARTRFLVLVLVSTAV